MRNKFLKIPYHELTIRCFVKYFFIVRQFTTFSSIASAIVLAIVRAKSSL